jgi:hypothetical protein
MLTGTVTQAATARYRKPHLFFYDFAGLSLPGLRREDARGIAQTAFRRGEELPEDIEDHQM